MSYQNFINLENVLHSFKEFKNNTPFDHCVIDNFFKDHVARNLSKEFLDYENTNWHCYKNSIENKKTCNNWNIFPSVTYQVFTMLNDLSFIKLISDLTGLAVSGDQGLNGGGWHIHAAGGILNPHLDYNIHPKLRLQRVINLIVYLSEELEEQHGGHLGLWTNDATAKQPDKLVREVVPKFNRAIFFNTTQNSWHGLSRPLTQPEGIYRKSIAVYYLKEPDIDADPRGRALFAPTLAQRQDKKVLELIKLRSDITASQQVYKEDSSLKPSQ